MDIIKQIETASLREVTPFNVGDTVRVNFKVIEGNKEARRTSRNLYG